MVLMPPGSAKSTYTSVVLPSWYIGRHPENSVIGASHTQDLADRFGRRVRNLASSRPHRAVFGVGVAAGVAFTTVMVLIAMHFDKCLK